MSFKVTTSQNLKDSFLHFVQDSQAWNNWIV